MKRLFTIAVMSTLSLLAEAQDADDTRVNVPDFSRIIDDLVGLQEGDAAYEEVYENLVQLMAHPIDLNSATQEELQRLHILNDKQIQALLDHRKENGKLVSLHELQSIPDFELNTIEDLLPFVAIIDPQQQLNASLLRRISEKNNTYFITRFERTLETKKGFSSSGNTANPFKGAEEKMYVRFRNSRPGDFSFGFTGENDSGERFQWRPSNNYYGMDFFSYHAQVINKGKLKNLVAGDYQCQFGQGLILGNAFGLGKGAETITTARRNNLGILPYTSANENGFYRGASATIQLHPNVLLSGFYSSVLRDASLVADSSDQYISNSLVSSGLHRNTPELEGRKQLLEKSWGTVLSVQFNRLESGMIIHHINFDKPVIKRPTAYNQFAFQGKDNTNAGVYLNYSINNFTFFSEAARSVSGGMALVAGTMASLHPSFDIALLYRKYDRNFYSFYANAFSENTLPQNETAFYWGWKYRWNRKYGMSGYVDQFKFPWLGFRRYAPAHGYEWLLRFNYQPNRKTMMFVQAREESKPRNRSEETTLYHVLQGKKRNFWLAAHYGIGEYLKFKSRIQYSTFSMNNHTSEGVALLQDISVTIGKLQVTARHALFDTDDFDNRQYVYENDVWLAFSLPAYEGKGVRNYVLLEYKVNGHLSLWLRYARTRYTDREEIGSGMDEIEGNTKNDLKFQALFKF